MPVLPPPSTAIALAYDPAQFRKLGHAVVDLLADQLVASQTQSVAVLPWREPAAALQSISPVEQRSGDALAELSSIVQHSTKLHDPRCAAHQVAPSLPLAALSELVAAHLNNGMAIYEMGPIAVPIELLVIEWLAKRVGFSAQASGVFTSGGSLGNLTALLAMRASVKARKTTSNDSLGIVLVGKHNHYSIARALAIMGWPAEQIVAVDLDDSFRMTAAAAQRAITPHLHRGETIAAIVASAGSTATGACDDLGGLAEVARKHNAWFHVDGAHGASLVLSTKQDRKSQLAGIELADSVVWDAHKMLMLPALITAVLFREPAGCYLAFSQEAPYLFAKTAPQQTWWDLGQRTVECTKRMMAMELYVALRTYGEDFFSSLVDRQCEIAARFAELIAESEDFQLATPPQMNIVCYRYAPNAWRTLPPSELDQRNRDLRNRIIRDGHFYIVATTLADRFWLRSSFMNPMANEQTLQALLNHIREMAEL